MLCNTVMGLTLWQRNIISPCDWNEHEIRFWALMHFLWRSNTMLTTAWDIINYIGNRQVIYEIIQYHVSAPNPLCQTIYSPHIDNHSMPKSSNHREISLKCHRELNTINENICVLILTDRSRIVYAKDLLVNALLAAMANLRMSTYSNKPGNGKCGSENKQSKNRIGLYR